MPSLKFTLAPPPAFSTAAFPFAGALLDNHAADSTIVAQLTDQTAYLEVPMRLIIRVAVVAIVLLSAQQYAAAQPFGGFRGNPLMLLRQESVQKELKLSDEQAQKVKELAEKTREKFQDIFAGDEADRPKKMQELAQENRKAVAEILSADQSKRLKEITLQQRGPAAFTDPEVAKALDLSEDQQTKIKSINEETVTAMRELFTPGQPPDDDTRKKMNDLRKTSGDKLLALLSADQKTKWTTLQGEPFKGEIRVGPPRQ
jgi:Spy/CpxP family protein refolding chaperone